MGGLILYCGEGQEGDATVKIDTKPMPPELEELLKEGESPQEVALSSELLDRLKGQKQFSLPDLLEGLERLGEKQLPPDVPPPDRETVEEHFAAVMEKALAALRRRVEARLRELAAEAEGEKHLPGKHDQKTPGKGWGGRISGGTTSQKEAVRQALKLIPPDILPEGLSVRFVPSLEKYIVGNPGMGKAVGFYSGKEKIINIRSDQDPIRNPDGFQHVVLHEAGHAVPGPSGGFYADRVDSMWKDTRKVSEYAKTNSGEGWAEAFSLRIATGAKLGVSSENTFKKLGI